MNTHLLYFLVLIALMFNSCNKKSLPPIDEQATPVFYFKCDVGGISLDFEAGINSYYMKSSYYQDSNSVYVFKGELKQKECSANCGYALTVLINDYKTTPNQTMIIDSTLALSTYQYNDGNLEPLYYSSSFAVNQISQNTIYNWSFTDGVALSSTNITRTLKANKTYSVALLANSSTYGSIDHTNVYKVGCALQTNIGSTKVNSINTSYQYKFFTTNTSGTPPFIYLWEFGDGTASQEPLPIHEYSVSDLYTPKLTLVDANNDTCISYYQLPVFKGLSGESNFNASFTPIQNTKALSCITILLTDQNGNTYSSKNFNQDKTSKFEIVSVEDYKSAENNLTFKKIKIKFNCTVYNGVNPLEIKNAEAVIAVAFKN